MQDYHIEFVRSLTRAAWAEQVKSITKKIQEDIVDEAKLGGTKIKVTGKYDIINDEMQEMVREYFTDRQFKIYHDCGYMIISWA